MKKQSLYILYENKEETIQQQLDNKLYQVDDKTF